MPWWPQKPISISTIYYTFKKQILPETLKQLNFYAQLFSIYSIIKKQLFWKTAKNQTGAVFGLFACENLDNLTPSSQNLAILTLQRARSRSSPKSIGIRFVIFGLLDIICVMSDFVQFEFSDYRSSIPM